MHAGGFCHISKSAIAVITVEAVPETRIGFVRRRATWHRILNLRSIHEEQINATVVVVVEHGHAAAHGLGQILLAGAAGFLFESNPGFGGHVGEHRKRR